MSTAIVPAKSAKVDELVTFEVAIQAVAKARTFYDARTIRDKAEALRAYGRIAKDRTIECDGMEIRLRAERRLGEMMAEAGKRGQLHRGAVETGGPGRGKKNAGQKVPHVSDKLTLESQGIDKHLAKHARTLARMTREDFEQRIAKLRNPDRRTPANPDAPVTRRSIFTLDVDNAALRLRPYLAVFEQKRVAAYAAVLLSRTAELSDQARASLASDLAALIRQAQHLLSTIHPNFADTSGDSAEGMQA